MAVKSSKSANSGSNSSDPLVIKIERSALERFRNENSLIKEFNGNDGIKVYRALDSNKKMSELLYETGLEEQRLREIIDFMDRNGMITLDVSEEDAKAVETQNYENVLTPTEKKIFDKYGERGLRTYSLIDGVRTANEIMEEANVTESELMEILHFLEKEGIITLDQQDQRSNGAGSSGSSASSESDYHPPEIHDESSAQPLDEHDFDNEDNVIDSGGDIIPIDLPFKGGSSGLNSFIELLKLRINKGSAPGKVHKAINGFLDVAQLCVALNMSLPELNNCLADLGKAKLILFRPLTRKEIKSRYGDDGLTIYRRYGVDGIVLYEYIGKIDDLRTMVMVSGIEPRLVVDIFIFIHKVLGIDIPVSRKLLYRQLGISE